MARKEVREMFAVEVRVIAARTGVDVSMVLLSLKDGANMIYVRATGVRQQRSAISKTWLMERTGLTPRRLQSLFSSADAAGVYALRAGSESYGEGEGDLLVCR
jgi:hypothetical protein